MKREFTTFRFSVLLTFPCGMKFQELHTVKTTDSDTAVNVVIDDIRERYLDKCECITILSVTEREYLAIRERLKARQSQLALLN